MILDYMTRVSPRLHRAEHFRLYAEKLERGVGGGLRVVVAAPPQHGGTQVTLHGVACLAQAHPGKRHAYFTYNQHAANACGRIVKRLLALDGVDVHESSTCDLVLPNGGKVLFRGVGAPLVGEAIDGVAVVDNPYKSLTEAESPTFRAVVESYLRETIETRIHPGASMFVLTPRMHPQDLSGVLIDEGWEYLNLQAIAEPNDPNGRAVGEPLFPALYPAEVLLEKKRRMPAHLWSAMFQGQWPAQTGAAE